MKSLIVLVLFYSASVLAEPPPPPPIIVECMNITKDTLGLKNPADTAPRSRAFQNCQDISRMNALPPYYDCLRMVGPGGAGKLMTTLRDCAQVANQANVQRLKMEPSMRPPRPPVGSSSQCFAEIRKVSWLKDATKTRYYKTNSTPAQCDLLLSCIDNAQSSGNPSFQVVDSCMSKPPGTMGGPKHPTSIQSSGQAPCCGGAVSP